MLCSGFISYCMESDSDTMDFLVSVLMFLLVFGVIHFISSNLCNNNIHRRSQMSISRMQIDMSRCMTKPTKCPVCLAKTRISLGICPVWSESSLSAWRNIGPLAPYWAHREDWSDWADAIFAGRTVILLVLPCGGTRFLFCFILFCIRTKMIKF